MLYVKNARRQQWSKYMVRIRILNTHQRPNCPQSINGMAKHYYTLQIIFVSFQTPSVPNEPNTDKHYQHMNKSIPEKSQKSW